MADKEKKKKSEYGSKNLFSKQDNVPSPMTPLGKRREQYVASMREEKTDLDPTRIYLQELGYKPLLTPREELRLARQVQSGVAQARNKMIEANLRLVVKIARHYCGRGLPFMDLVEEGNIGLITSVGKFDPDKGFRFSTYATWWIRQTIERAIMNQSRTVRLPIHIIKELNSYLRASSKLLHELDHEPSTSDIAREMCKPVRDVQRILDLAPDTTSIDIPIMQDVERPLVEIISDVEDNNPEYKAHSLDLRDKITKWLYSLNSRHREIVARRFGLLNYKSSTLEETGDAVGLTRERVRQLQAEAIEKLKRIIKSEDI